MPMRLRALPHAGPVGVLQVGSWPRGSARHRPSASRLKVWHPAKSKGTGTNAVATARGKGRKKHYSCVAAFGRRTWRGTDDCTPACRHVPRRGKDGLETSGWPHQSQASRPLRRGPGLGTRVPPQACPRRAFPDRAA